ncbi:MAG: M6 family metalloprotease domain-containing protein [Bacteroidales bacterium]|nr:M6 family metalloprotease domain-containing protein [Bacteroidales bacterium]
MKSRVIGLLIMCLSFGIAFANPADTTLKSVIQKDKRILSFYLFGDEWLSWAKTTDGYTLLPNEEGVYCYAEMDSRNNLVASSFVATNLENRTAEERVFLSTIEKGLTYSSIQKADARNKIPQSSKSYPTIGNNNLLVILVEFPNREFTHTQADFQNLLSQEGYSAYGAVGSVKDYYRDCSSGQLNLTPTVVGPVMLSQNVEYYGAPGPSFVDVRPKEMVSEACVLVDSYVDFSQFDMNNDGRIDAVHVIFAGGPESTTGEANAIWPHRWSIYESDGLQQLFDGVILSDYSCSGEKRGSFMDGIGTICHEFGHVLGLPDFYDTDYDETGGDAQALSTWSIMSSGSYNNNGNTPASFNANERNRLGWLSFDTLTIEGAYSLPPLTDSNRAYIITTPYENEYFILENRIKESWDAHIPASGMLIYHIKNEGDYCINCNPAYQKCDIEEADGVESDNSLMADVFPNSQSYDFFTDYAFPNSKLWSGEELGKPVTNIVRDTSDGMIYFDFMRPDSSAVISTINSAVFESTVTVKLKGFEQYEGLYDYTLKGFALDTVNSFVTQSFFAANTFIADTFEVVLNNLDYSTTYYYRAVYLSATDTVYGDYYTFFTRDGQPQIKTNQATNVGLTSFTASGKKLIDGDFPVLEYGIFYDTIQSLDSTSNTISFQGDFTTFSTEVTGLEQATKYYFAAYCKTALGIKVASRSSVTTSFVPVENNEIAAEMTGCEGDEFGTIVGETPTAGQGNFTYLWQKKTSSSSWQSADNNNTEKDYFVGVLSEPTSFRRIVYSLAIKDTSNVVDVDVKQSKGGKIKAKKDWISSEIDTLTLQKHNGTIVQWEHSCDTIEWNVFSTLSDTSVAYKPAYFDTMYLRTMVRFEQCPERYSEVLKIFVLQDVSLAEMREGVNYVVYPNPAKDFVEIKNEDGRISAVRLFDANSRQLFFDNNIGNSYQINLSAYRAGVYILRLETEKAVEVYDVKLIIAD